MKKNYTGLNNESILKNQKLYGLNNFEIKKKNKIIKNIISILKEPMFILLITCVIVYLFLGEKIDAIILGISVIIVITIQIRQQIKTDKTLEALKKFTNPMCNVIRNSKIEKISSEEVTIDDILVLNEGDKIVADAIILESYNLNVDESLLTGESIPVEKSTDLIDKNAHFKSNYLYSGTLITKGNCIAKVINIGLNTEYGKIANHLSSIKEEKSPLQKQVDKIASIFLKIAIISFILIIIIVSINTKSFIEGLLSSLTVAISIIPEEFPLVLTIFLSLGAYRIAKKNAVIKNLLSVETLGSITYLCVDKTGTLTKNKMEVNTVDTKLAPTKFFTNALLASDEKTFDPMENAIKEYSSNLGVSIKQDDLELIKKYPFNNENKMMANVYNFGNEKHIYVKGALESLFDICDLTVEEKYELHTLQGKMAKNGLRVIAVGSKKISKIENDIFDYRINFDGLIGFYDPPKANVEQAVKLCEKAGIKIIMMTGDHKETASAIAKNVGIKNYNNVISGKELDEISDIELESIVKNIGVFARVIPSHKLRIVTALRKNNEVVAMTGDGVNDAPALKRADIGIAMGERGTEVAKEASDLILLDDNFTTIVNTISDARRIYANIKKSIKYIIVMHIPIILLAILVPLFKFPVFLLPIHIVVMELITDPTCSIIFERQKANKNIMNNPPRKKDELLVNVKSVLNCLIRGIIMFTFVFVSYIILSDNKEVAMSFSFGMLLLSSMFLTYSMLFEDSDLSVIKNTIKDKAIIAINILILLIVSSFIYIPFFNEIFKTAPLNIWMLMLMIFLSFISVFWINIGRKKKNER